tara:strand:- start:2042 stop:2803 length:762 start_codon:yes stop_codon:yes gene_type:complete
MSTRNTVTYRKAWWLWAHDLFKRARDKSRGKPLMGNQSTYIVVSRTSPVLFGEDGCVFALKLHGTEIIRYYPNNCVAVSLAGWNTITTKQRVRAYSPLNIGSRGDQVMAFNPDTGQTWIGCEYTWFYWKEGLLVFSDYGPTPNLLHCRARQRVPQQRDTLTDMKDGDAFREGKRFWVCALNVTVYPRSLALFPYYGDCQADRGLAVTDREATPRPLPGRLELLASATGEGLRPINRFIWSREAWTAMGEDHVE